MTPEQKSAKILQDLGAEMASLRADYEKTKPGPMLDALKAEIGACKIKIESMGVSVEEALDADWAGFWVGAFK